MNLLITGAAGFIGSHFALRHAELKPEDKLVILDKLTYAGDRSYLDSIADKIEFVHGDIADQRLVNQLVENHQIEVIVNFAAETHVDNSIKEASPFLHTNVIGTQSLIEVVKAYPEVLLLHISTDEVYGGLADGQPPCTTETALNPCNPYSASKAAGDYLVLAAVHTYGIRARITRCTNNYGPHQASEKFLPVVIGSALKDQPIPVYGEGKQKRDWLYVTDHTDAVELVLGNGQDGNIYLISADSERENIETAKKVLDELGKPHDLIEFVTDRPGHDFRYALDSSSIKALGWSPKVNFEEGLKKTIEWYSNRVS
ncbi:MAG: dTDP-glucose 4,6-dehydratase [Candidatus Peribacteraceae bacterium]|jgi:dTDP-glucose 4,6-dehydratase|nr:dTDP-glucose 4,6-dehydratase [Candidatus Peribacteraceae bacterium]MDP7454701.1 dTDP-glucose 4,6-dehydratase [Candidatus Peribacteraceae bacterium]MDP7646364.1 dTDP-glucose 4,6-dehydratase [Candidatus Peribacteraceae bacterium]|tara:strand:- start:651 stop:1592 length:942 start_codon:yes stop_codon:yes gene_type:complete